MEIIYYNHNDNQPEIWLNSIKKHLPQANIRIWQPGDTAKADYALVWMPPIAMLEQRNDLKAIFTLSAGVDAILEIEQAGYLPQNTPIIRLEDAGMADQMIDYAIERTLYYFRQFNIYSKHQQNQHWEPLPYRLKSDFIVGILGAGTLGGAVAQSIASFGFQVRTWSQSPKNWKSIHSFHGEAEFIPFLSQCNVLINLLPNTPQTKNILNKQNLTHLANQAYLINIARGAHLVDNDLLELLKNQKLAGATLDVFNQEPLQKNHPYWNHPDITITPHIAAATIPAIAIEHIVHNILQIENGQKPKGIVNINRGY